MKKFLATLSVVIAFSAVRAMAIPSLQLYIDPANNPDAYYDTTTQTWVSPTPEFELTATALDRNYGSPQGDAFYGSDTTAILSVALFGDLPAGNEGDTLGASDLGTVKINGVSYSNWTYGIPPVEDDLQKHGIFPTWYLEYSFQFYPSYALVKDFQPGSDGTQKLGFKKDFDIDLSMLNGEVGAHFDLYTLDREGEIHKFAPFSHDAEGIPTPEPATLFLLSAGLLGIGAVRRRRA